MVRSRKRGRASKFDGIKGYHPGAKCRFESGLEKRFLDLCYRHGVRVKRCEVQVPYRDAEGKWHRYHPDFELTDFRFVVEVKGMWAVKTNHASVREKFWAAKDRFKNRFVMVTEVELRSDYVSRLVRSLSDEAAQTG